MLIQPLLTTLSNGPSHLALTEGVHTRLGFGWACLWALLAGCSGEVQANAGSGAEAAPSNVLLITVDTLRADALGTYGYERSTSPAIDALASTATQFERAYSTSSWTLPSLASLVTSTYPSTHRATANHANLSPAFDTLGEGLERMGFRTAAVSSHIFLAGRYGLHQGVQEHDEELVHVFRDRNESHKAITSPEVTAKSIAWIDDAVADDPERPWFLWAHYFDPHNTYQPHAGITEGLGATPRDLYDGEIQFTDGHIGGLLDHLEGAGLASDTIVVLVSDHGEEFGEHGGKLHRRTLYEEVLRVPLLIRVPGAAPQRVSQPVSVVDVAPTLLELVGSPPSDQHVGRSLVPALYGQAVPNAPLLGELFEPGAKKTCIIDGDYKLIWNQTQRKREWYDLSSDPGEQRRQRVGVAVDRKLLGQLQDMRERARKDAERYERSEGVDLSETDLTALKSLGYGGDEDE